jgi:hypothetical protein
MKVKRLLFLLLILFAVAGYYFATRPVSHGPGQVAPDEPLQSATPDDAFEFNGFTLFPLADFEMEARVLAKKHYSRGTEAKLSPWDIAFGWGTMSDEAILKDINISQSNRFYFWRVNQFPIPARDIETNSANMHLIPADKEIKIVLDKVRVGEVLWLSGQLIKAEGPGGWAWKSSTTRSDTGKGACEVIFVTDIEIVDVSSG